MLKFSMNKTHGMYGMNFSQIIILIMACISLLSALDKVFGNKLKLGNEYENGILTIGQLVLSMIGIMVLSPIIAQICMPIISPIYKVIGADSSVFAGSIFACDMGGASLAYEMSENIQLSQFSGILIGSTLGATVSFTIPVALASTEPCDRPFVSKGILCGLITIPVGVILGGITAGFSISLILLNTVPVAILSSIIAIGLYKAEKITITVFTAFGKIISSLAILGLAIVGFQEITDIVILKNIGSFSESFIIVAEIAVVLSGAFPLISILKKILIKPVKALENVMKINNMSVMGLIATLANSIATFGMIKSMDNRGKVINMAFSVSAAFVFGDHLAFTSGFDSFMILPLIVCKLTAGLLSIVLAFFVTKKEKKYV